VRCWDLNSGRRLKVIEPLEPRLDPRLHRSRLAHVAQERNGANAIWARSRCSRAIKESDYMKTKAMSI
jgi:hypothetical protein